MTTHDPRQSARNRAPLTSIPRLSPPGSGDDGLLADVLGLPYIDGVGPSEMLAVGCAAVEVGPTTGGLSEVSVRLADGRVLAGQVSRADADALGMYLGATDER